MGSICRVRRTGTDRIVCVDITYGMLSGACVLAIYDRSPTAAIQALTSNDKRHVVNTSELLAQLLNVAVTCDGAHPVLSKGCSKSSHLFSIHS